MNNDQNKPTSDWSNQKRLEFLEKRGQEFALLLEGAAFFLQEDDMRIQALQKRIEQLENKLNSLN